MLIFQSIVVTANNAQKKHIGSTTTGRFEGVIVQMGCKHLLMFDICRPTASRRASTCKIEERMSSSLKSPSDFMTRDHNQINKYRLISRCAQNISQLINTVPTISIAMHMHMPVALALAHMRLPACVCDRHNIDHGRQRICALRLRVRAQHYSEIASLLCALANEFRVQRRSLSMRNPHIWLAG